MPEICQLPMILLRKPEALLSTGLALAEGQLVDPTQREDVGNIVGADAYTDCSCRLGFCTGGPPDPKPVSAPLFISLRIRVCHLELEPGAHAPLERGLEGIVVAVSEWEKAPVDLLVLRPMVLAPAPPCP